MLWLKKGWRMMRRKILVVDDDNEVREIASFVLTLHGFDVSTAANGAQLQEKLAIERLPDLIILDITMPGENGYRLCQVLRHSKRTKHIPIMIITAHAESIYARISKDLGAVQHVSKPFHPLELVKRVQCILG